MELKFKAAPCEIFQLIHFILINSQVKPGESSTIENDDAETVLNELKTTKQLDMGTVSNRMVNTKIYELKTDGLPEYLISVGFNSTWLRRSPICPIPWFFDTQYKTLRGIVGRIAVVEGEDKTDYKKKWNKWVEYLRNGEETASLLQIDDHTELKNLLEKLDDPNFVTSQDFFNQINVKRAKYLTAKKTTKKWEELNKQLKIFEEGYNEPENNQHSDE